MRNLQVFFQWWQVRFHVEELSLLLPGQIYQQKICEHKRKGLDIPGECFGSVYEGWPGERDGDGRGQVQVSTCLAQTVGLRHISWSSYEKIEKIV